MLHIFQKLRYKNIKISYPLHKSKIFDTFDENKKKLMDSETGRFIHACVFSIIPPHYVLYNEAPQTGVFKNDWITLWVITP